VKYRRHHNNKGLRQIKRGKTYWQVKAMARRLRVTRLPAGKKEGLATERLTRPAQVLGTLR